MISDCEIDLVDEVGKNFRKESCELLPYQLYEIIIRQNNRVDNVPVLESLRPLSASQP